MYLFRNHYPLLEGERVYLQEPTLRDYSQWSQLRLESMDFLTPWEPAWSRSDINHDAYKRLIQRYKTEYRAGKGYAFFIFDKTRRKLLGGLSLSNVKHGVSQSATIGYWMGERYAGLGLMQDAIKRVIPFSFNTLGLHRLEAACIPTNIRSIRVLEKAGFQCEGLLRSYLCINGSWQDHNLYALIAGEYQSDSERG